MAIIHSFCGWVVFHFIYMPYLFFNLFIYQWAFSCVLVTAIVDRSAVIIGVHVSLCCLFIWLCPVSVAARSILGVSCRIFPDGTYAPEHVGFVVSVYKLSCSVACGVLSPSTRDQNHIPCIGRWVLNRWITRGAPHTSFWIRLFISSRYIPRSGIAGL